MSDESTWVYNLVDLRSKRFLFILRRRCHSWKYNRVPKSRKNATLLTALCATLISWKMKKLCVSCIMFWPTLFAYFQDSPNLEMHSVSNIHSRPQKANICKWNRDILDQYGTCTKKLNYRISWHNCRFRHTVQGRCVIKQPTWGPTPKKCGITSVLRVS